MTATPQQARFVFEEWHRLITARDGVGLAALYTADAVLESPLAPRVLDSDSGVVHGGDGLEEFVSEVTRRRPEEDQLPSLYRTGTRRPPHPAPPHLLGLAWYRAHPRQRAREGHPPSKRIGQ